ncbi:unknown [[Mannheimia] succiniciproducens MBEL55E]|uniref:Uncharacterized protein n=1 Tax=Mannheimia succiniciproducens (strain KCTC 0769BP / MBEL55E) TaxID=221988 RepID=Q65UM0_MANSM|nr:unknown [[Mannheimia] succiniciproducens MBEL55E]
MACIIADFPQDEKYKGRNIKVRSKNGNFQQKT